MVRFTYVRPAAQTFRAEQRDPNFPRGKRDCVYGTFDSDMINVGEKIRWKKIDRLRGGVLPVRLETVGRRRYTRSEKDAYDESLFMPLPRVLRFDSNERGRVAFVRENARASGIRTAFYKTDNSILTRNILKFHVL